MHRPEQPGLFGLRAGGRSSVLPIDRHFDVAFADEMARLESYNKHHYRPNTYMHKWWARRCGSTFRLILKHLVEDELLRDYYAPGGLEGAVILDPMMGGGTTLHEALRLGANVIGVDIDPIPVLQARATLSDVPLSRLEEGFATLQEALSARLAPLFHTACPHCQCEVPLRFMLYAARRHCACGPVLVADSTILRYEEDGATLRLCERCHAVTRDGANCACPPLPDRPPLVPKELTGCGECGERYQENTTIPYYRRYAPLVVVAACPTHGLFYEAPRAGDLRHLEAADARRSRLALGARAGFDVPSGLKSRDLLGRGVSSFIDLFSSRQLIYLEEAIRLLPRFEPLVRLNLALLVSTSLEFNSLLCGYKGVRRGERPGAIRHTFSYHAYAFPYTALENNLLYPQKASGTLEKLFHDRIRRARKWALRPRERRLTKKRRFSTIMGEREIGLEVADLAAFPVEKGGRFLLRQQSAASLPLPDDSVDFVVTDPPYYDSVQYSDLATFFRVWLQRLLPEGARWEYDFADSAVDPNGNGSGQYRDVLSRIFSECARVLRPAHGRLIFTFHNWKAQGWTALTLALQRAGFQLRSCYVVHSENPISVHINGLRALTHDAILVLALPPQSSPAGIQPRSWRRPGAIDKTESARFCEDCALLLGWLLQARLPEAEVARHWEEALR
ncbi:MAG: hypothetical protein R3272_00405 [Candidatus Promineifilaceae bacterium]|nr:hypothetical protein [Candidatus Promineifilaceae bacterium]